MEAKTIPKAVHDENAPIYDREVCDLCLNCRRPECTGEEFGCDAYRAAIRKAAARGVQYHGRRRKK